MATFFPIILVLFCLYSSLNAQLTKNCQTFIDQNAFFELKYPADTYCWTCTRTDDPENNPNACASFDGRENGINLRFQVSKAGNIMSRGLAGLHNGFACPDKKPMTVCSVKYVCPRSGINPLNGIDVHNPNVLANKRMNILTTSCTVS